MPKQTYASSKIKKLTDRPDHDNFIICGSFGVYSEGEEIEQICKSLANRDIGQIVTAGMR